LYFPVMAAIRVEVDVVESQGRSRLNAGLGVGSAFSSVIHGTYSLDRFLRLERFRFSPMPSPKPPQNPTISSSPASQDRPADSTHLKEYLAASLKYQSASPACSFCPHKSNICCTLPPKHSSNDLITAAPAVNFTLFHSFTKALMVHSVLISTVWVVEVVASVWRWDKQVWRLLRRVWGREVHGFGNSILAIETRSESWGRAIYY